MNDKDKSFFAKLIFISVVFIAFLTVLGLMAELVKNKRELKPQPQSLVSLEFVLNWNIYNNLEASFTFKYPKDWEITEDYFYETAAGSKAIDPTVILQKIGNSNINDEIAINARQYSCEGKTGKCVDLMSKGINVYIGTHTENLEILAVFDKIVGSFEKKAEIADWKTYKNEKYGFEIKYPQSIIVKEKDLSESNLIRFIIDFGKISNNQPVRISVINEDMIGAVEEAMAVTSRKAIIIDGVKGSQIIGQGQKDGSAAESIVLLIKNQKLYQIIGSGNVFDQILSTFKFTEK